MMNLRRLIENELKSKKIEDVIEKHLKGKYVEVCLIKNGINGFFWTKIKYVTYDPDKTYSVLLHIRVVKTQEAEKGFQINRLDISRILSHFNIKDGEWGFTEF